MRNIKKDIEKKTIKPVYLICGEERYLVRSAKKLLLNALVEDGNSMNFLRLRGKECNVQKIMDFADTLPFFAEYRVILIEDSQWFKGAPDELVEYVKKIPDTSCLIFVEQEVDKRNRLFKQVNTNGYVCECKRASDKELMDWMVRYLAKEGRKITQADMEHLLEKLGDNMERIMSEMEKLVAYTLGSDVITREDIDEICVGEITGKIFDMIDAIGNQNKQKALKLYYDLIATREAPMKILNLMIRQFNIMLQLKELERARVSFADMVSKVGLQAFVVKKTLAQCRNFEYTTLRGALRYCTTMEESVKQGNINEKVAVELIIIKYAAYEKS